MRDPRSQAHHHTPTPIDGVAFISINKDRAMIVNIIVSSHSNVSQSSTYFVIDIFSFRFSLILFIISNAIAIIISIVHTRNEEESKNFEKLLK